MGCLILVLAMGALGSPPGDALARLALGDLRGQPGPEPGPVHEPDLGGPRAGRRSRNLPVLQDLVQEIGPLDTDDDTPIRLDRFMRDGDGSIYWWISTLLPGFRQFRFPAKLFTFTSLALAALAGLGWDGLRAERHARITATRGRAAGLEPGRAGGRPDRTSGDPGGIPGDPGESALWSLRSRWRLSPRSFEASRKPRSYWPSDWWRSA